MTILVTGGAGFICANFVPGEIFSCDEHSVEFDSNADAYDTKGCHAAIMQRAAQAVILPRKTPWKEKWV